VCGLNGGTTPPPERDAENQTHDKAHENLHINNPYIALWSDAALARLPIEYDDHRQPLCL